MEEHQNPSEMWWQWKCWFPYENANTHIRKAQSTSNHYRISRFRSETMQYEINCIGPLFPAFSHTNKWIKRRHFFRSLVVAFPLSPEKIEEGLSHSYIIKRNNGCWFGYFVNCKWNREMRSRVLIWLRSAFTVRLERVHAFTHSHTHAEAVFLRKCKQRTAFFLSQIRFSFLRNEWNEGKKNLMT